MKCVRWITGLHLNYLQWNDIESRRRLYQCTTMTAEAGTRKLKKPYDLSSHTRPTLTTTTSTTTTMCHISENRLRFV